MRLSVHVCPGAKKSSYAGVYLSGIKLKISAPPVDGKANEAVTTFLTSKLGISKRSATVASGHTSRDKIIEIETKLSKEEIIEILSRG